jgi:predicted regulator of Ras-like GTPase activity (Roadblock/LC7/MglB family)
MSDGISSLLTRFAHVQAIVVSDRDGAVLAKAGDLQDMGALANGAAALAEQATHLDKGAIRSAVALGSQHAAVHFFAPGGVVTVVGDEQMQVGVLQAHKALFASLLQQLTADE